MHLHFIRGCPVRVSVSSSALSFLDISDLIWLSPLSSLHFTSLATTTTCGTRTASHFENMCMLNFSPYDSEGPDYPLPRGRPRLAWVIPVDMAKLGASLQAINDTMPQTTILRLCHRSRDGPLSRLPQELLEHIIDDVQRAERASNQPKWYQDSVCWQGTCLPEDHYSIYSENVEKLWQKMLTDKRYGPTNQPKPKHTTEAEKIEMVQGWMGNDPEAYESEEGWSLHFDSRFRWLDRTCVCPESYSTAGRQVGNFTPLQNVSEVYTSVICLLIGPDSQNSIRSRSNHSA